MSTPETLTCFTINGYDGVWNAGPQFEVGQHLSGNPVDNGLGLAYLQPIGYNCSQFPLNLGVTSGLAELENQRQQHPGPYFICRLV